MKDMCNKVAAEDAFTKAKKDRNYRKFAGDYLKTSIITQRL